MVLWFIRRVTDLLKGPLKLWIVSSYPQLKGPLNLWIVWCGYGVRQSREGVKNGHGWGMGPERCPVHAWRASAPPQVVGHLLVMITFKCCSNCEVQSNYSPQKNYSQGKLSPKQQKGDIRFSSNNDSQNLLSPSSIQMAVQLGAVAAVVNALPSKIAHYIFFASRTNTMIFCFVVYIRATSGLRE